MTRGRWRAKRAALWLLQKTAELAAVALDVYVLAALAALNVPALLVCLLQKIALLSLWSALK